MSGGKLARDVAEAFARRFAEEAAAALVAGLGEAIKARLSAGARLDEIEQRLARAEEALAEMIERAERPEEAET